METQEERMNVFGTYISCIDLEKGFHKVVNYDFHKPNYICFPSTNLIADAYKDDKLREIYNNSFITFADGKFTEFYARLKGNYKLKNVSGYELLNKLLDTSLTHYFYGLSGDNISRLKEKILNDHPRACVLGYKSPPILEIEQIDFNEQIMKDISQINELKPNLIWVGISYPKQEYLMSCYYKYFSGSLMFGVGAVLLYKAGIVRLGPPWIKALGFRWLVRLVQEPRRLWKRMIPGLIYFLFILVKHDIFRINIKEKTYKS